MNNSLIVECIHHAHAANFRNESDAAIWWSKKALAISPEIPEAWFNLGLGVAGKGDRREAIKAFQKSASLTPQSADAQNSIGYQLMQIDAHVEARNCFDAAIKLDPNLAAPYLNLGIIHASAHENEYAIAMYKAAIEKDPACAPAFANLSAIYQELKEYKTAEAMCRRAIDLNPNLPDVWNNLGLVHLDQGRLHLAEACFRKSLDLGPEVIKVWKNLTELLMRQKKLPEALDCINRVLVMNPDEPYMQGQASVVKASLCEWTNRSPEVHSLISKVREGARVANPFLLFYLTDDSAVQQQCAQTFIADALAHFPPMLPSSITTGPHQRIRIGYFSADFREHPVSHLMVELLQNLDKEKFESFGFSYGVDTQDAMRKKIAATFENFINVHHMTDADIAKLARERGIDIAVDLGGHTDLSRPWIFSHRAAPVQVSYLGYAGTTGAEFMDYLIADKSVVPAQEREFYAENLALLPHCFLPYNSQQTISSVNLSRQNHGLPADGFVFCCFNLHTKFSPEVFDIWMRLLSNNPKSVLWLSSANRDIIENLSKEASARGVAPSRLIYAPRLEDMSEHLARYRLADLFIDTFPYNAHTTAIDALWAGLPVLTCKGRSFSSRVAASLLNTVGIPELITDNFQDYENLASALVNDPQRLSGIREKLQANKLSSALFDMPELSRSLEVAFVNMHKRYQQGLKPSYFES